MTVIDNLQDATHRLIRTVDGLPDDGWRAPSLLPGWTRAHVVAHLALNAEGLRDALVGVVEGEAVPMYASQESRDGDIEALAGEAPEVLRTRLLAATTRLDDAVAAVPPDRADTRIARTAGSDRTFTAAQVAPMRVREVEIHHADLDAGFGPGDWPAEFSLRLLEQMIDRPLGADLVVVATEVGREWTVGAGGPRVSGPSYDLAWWLTGRPPGALLTCEGGTLPHIEEW